MCGTYQVKAERGALESAELSDLGRELGLPELVFVSDLLLFQWGHGLLDPVRHHTVFVDSAHCGASARDRSSVVVILVHRRWRDLGDGVAHVGERSVVGSEVVLLL